MQKQNLDWLTARPIAHRGLHHRSQGVVENTSTAFARAIDAGYAIECDLQITADGEAVVFHDETLDRLTAETGLLKCQSTRDLKEVPIIGCNDRMQTLAELLVQVNGKVPLIIELKSHWDGDTALAARALKVLEHYQGPHALMSFDPDLVAAVAQLSPKTIRGVTADRAEDSYYDALPTERRAGLQTQSYLQTTKPHFVSFAFRDLPLPTIQSFRDSGNKVISWTIRSKEEERIALAHSDQITFESYLA